MSDLTKKNPEHKVYLDVLRIMCITLVVFNHTPAYNQPILSPIIDNLFTLLISISVKIAVPIFFMISGGVLLKKEESLSYLLCKRVFRFILAIILFSLIQYSYVSYLRGTDPLLIGYVVVFLNPCILTIYAHVAWFLYAYLGFLLMLPLLRLMVRNISCSICVYAVALFLFFQVVLPSVVYLGSEKISKLEIMTYIPLFSDAGTFAILFFIAGYYIEEKVRIEKVSLKCFCCLALLSFVFIVADGLLTCHAAKTSDIYSKTVEQFPWFSSAVFPACVFIYLLVKKIFLSWNISPRFQWLLSKLGGAVFTVFFIENILRNAYSPLFENYNKEYWPSVWVALLTVASGLVIGLIVKQIPGLKKIL